jgi:acyl dehydratase
MLDYQALKNWDFGDTVHSYGSRDAMLYALGIGIGANPLDLNELRFVYEGDLQVVPTFAATLAWPGMWWRDPRTGVDVTKLVQGEQHLRLFEPLPPQATLVGRQKVESITDKGIGKGAVAVVVRELFDQASNKKLAELRAVNFLRGDGGYSAQSGLSDAPMASLAALPDAAPDWTVDMPTLPQSALIYRLSGDYNPLHADPAAARLAGFPRPILHGLATMGYSMHAVLRACCEWDASRVTAAMVRFSAPVFPGETLRFDIWRENPCQVRVRGRVEARAVTVLDRGLFELS